MSGIYGVILHEEVAGPRQRRNVTIFADGEVDRSPCGSGTAARVTTLAASGLLAPVEELLHESIVGSRLTARYATDGDAVAAVITAPGSPPSTSETPLVQAPETR
ncbi:proline racemase family protein [Catenuloplanes indicus]|uniref:Proline racemase n=1 Tax=Catenuloplanes indicus TaxID=137267 RepID=A0AAE3W797_9ACTN|nr:proline racemase family protein [Catenuloplanes indicus]MDQ0371278.1 proline racemase [Catenuloplanes indicus]